VLVDSNAGGQRLRLSEKQVNAFLFAAQGVGAAFVVIFLAAYLGGLFVVPQTTVFHSVPEVRLILSVLGALLVVMVLSAFVLAALSKKE
jgi:hypothetical protein